MLHLKKNLKTTRGYSEMLLPNILYDMNTKIDKIKREKTRPSIKREYSSKVRKGFETKNNNIGFHMTSRTVNER